MKVTRRIMRHMKGEPCAGCDGVIGAKDIAVVIDGDFYHDPPCAGELLEEENLRTLREQVPCSLNAADPTGWVTFGTTTVKPEKK